MLLVAALLYLGWNRSKLKSVVSVASIAVIFDLFIAVLFSGGDLTFGGLVKWQDVLAIILAGVINALIICTIIYFLGRGLGWLWRRFVSKADKPPAPASAEPAPAP